MTAGSAETGQDMISSQSKISCKVILPVNCKILSIGSVALKTKQEHQLLISFDRSKFESSLNIMEMNGALNEFGTT